MRWNRKRRSTRYYVKKKFAFFPVRIEDEWIWWETYYEFICWNTFSSCESVVRFNNQEEVDDWLSLYKSD